MPKRPADDYASDDGFVANDSSDTGAGKSSKRFKITSNDDAHGATKQGKSKSSESGKRPKLVDENGDEFWELNANGSRRVTLSNFKGKVFINVREYYEADNGERKPGKKGISLPIDQFTTLVEVLPQIEKGLKQKGAYVPRPSYGDDHEVENEHADEDKSRRKKGRDEAKLEKQNFEATSDEDED